MRLKILFTAIIAGFCGVILTSFRPDDHPFNEDTLLYKGEKHFKNIKQLTFGGDNAEAYFSFSGRFLSFQARYDKWNAPCDQIYMLEWQRENLKTNNPHRISNGLGRTTCSYFLPGDSLILYASTHQRGDSCPPLPEPRKDHKYVWPLYDYDIFIADTNGNIRKQLTDLRSYDAEATVSPKGDKIIFTSTRNGDLDLYIMNIDGSDIKQITKELGYDGGAFFSPDGKQIVWRASRPRTESEVAEYKALLKDGLVMPTSMALFIANADGSNARQITFLPNASWAPYWHPSGKKIVFASNYKSSRGLPFNLYLINTDGTGLEQFSFDSMFDAFPFFSPDGKKIVFSSNRNNKGTHETNLFIADWVE